MQHAPPTDKELSQPFPLEWLNPIADTVGQYITRHSLMEHLINEMHLTLRLLGVPLSGTAKVEQKITALRKHLPAYLAPGIFEPLSAALGAFKAYTATRNKFAHGAFAFVREGPPLVLVTKKVTKDGNWRWDFIELETACHEALAMRSAFDAIRLANTALVAQLVASLKDERS